MLVALTPDAWRANRNRLFRVKSPICRTLQRIGTVNAPAFRDMPLPNCWSLTDFTGLIPDEEARWLPVSRFTVSIGFPQYLFGSFFDFFVCHGHADIRLLGRILRKNVGREIPNWLAISAPVNLPLSHNARICWSC